MFPDPGDVVGGGTLVTVVPDRDGARLRFAVDGATVEFDVTPPRASRRGPFDAAGLCITYRNAALPFERIATVGRALGAWIEGRHGAAAITALDAWVERSRTQGTGLVTGGRARGVFVLEARLLRALETDVGAVGSGVRAFLDAAAGGAGPVSLDLYLRAPCLQRCEFCTMPFGRDHRIAEELRNPYRVSSVAVLDAAIEWLVGRGPGGQLTLLGDDWAMHPEIDGILARLAAEQRVDLALIGPGTRLADGAFAARIAGIPRLVHLALTLQSTDAARHDAMVGRVGAGHEVLAALSHLRRLGFTRVGVHCVLTRSAVADLHATVRFAAQHGHRLTLAAFVPDRTDAREWDPAPRMPSPAEVRAALESVEPSHHTAIAALHGLPVCAVPPALRDRLRSTWQSPESEPFVHPPGCLACVHRPRCVGVPAPLLLRDPDGGVLPEPPTTP